MAVKELIRADYDSIKASLDNGQSVNEVARQFNVGNRRVSLVRKSKSFNSYVQLRAVERRKRAENTPAKAVAGSSDLEQPNQQFMATPTDSNQSLPADQVKPTAAGELDARTPEQKAQADEQARQAKIRTDAEERNRKYARDERNWKIAAITVVVLAIIGVLALIWGAVHLIFN